METVGRLFWGTVALLKSGGRLAWSTAGRLFSGFELFQRRARIILVGLDGSGKTTLLHVLKRDLVLAHEPTTHPLHEEIAVNNVRFQAFDLGGHQAARVLWRRYLLAGLDGIVFIVDAADPARFAEARAEIALFLQSDAVNNLPLLVLGNKIDAKGAVSRPVLQSALGLDIFLETDDLASDRPPGLPPSRPMHLVMCSVVRRWGYDAGFAWLANNLPPTTSTPD